MTDGMRVKNNGSSKSLEFTFKVLSALDRNEVLSKKRNLESKNPSPASQLKLFLWQRFSHLPISRKYLISLISAELVTILGIGIGSTLIINQSEQTQLREQAQSEVAVDDVIYNIKINQMSLGFLSLSENPIIIEAAENYTNKRSISEQIVAEVKQILQKEVQNREIEYATLVGLDSRIIISANANRIGELFNPDGIVSQVIKHQKPIRVNGVVSWNELQREAPPFPPGFRNEDALIRYTVTPVWSQQKIVGVLIAGDIVNGKQALVEETLKTTDDSYSAIYTSKGGGEFTLASSLSQDPVKESTEPRFFINLPDRSILVKAAASQGKTVTTRMVIDNQSYTIAAKAIPNQIIKEASGQVPVYTNDPAAILVRGIPESRLNNILWQSRLLVLLVALCASAAIAISALILKRVTIAPIQELQKTAEKFAQGDRTARVEVISGDEIGQLAVAFNSMADIVAEETLQHKNQAKTAHLVNKIADSLRRTLNKQEIFNAAVNNLRKAIKADRVIVYWFDENWKGKIVAESVSPEFPTALGKEIADPCFARNYVEKYQKGRVKATKNIYLAGLTSCHIAQLEHFAVKANLVAPILTGNKLYGLLIAHQCESERDWQSLEINLTRLVGVQIGYALEQAELLEQVEQARLSAEIISQEQRQHKETLQQQLLVLLKDIEGASRGDLTVHSQVTQGEIGVVSDFFNSIVESLRDIVTKVKASAIQVNASVGSNDDAMRQLAQEALKQSIEISRTLENVEKMTFSIQTVASSADKAAIVAHTASCTARESGDQIDMTVNNIMQLRQTISDTAKKVKRLGESSQQISQVVCLINQIAMQTNLLAVNAGLEAARAGENSHGFAAIATEVSSLATRCSDATLEIEKTVEKIQRETNQVARAMELGTQQVVESTSVALNAKNSLGQILEVSKQIDELVQSISQATASQVDTSRTVTQLMEDIAKVSSRTSDFSNKVSQSLQQTVEISRELQATVSTFKVN